MKILLILIHFFTVIYLSGAVIVSIGAFFPGAWGIELRRWVPMLKKLTWIWGVCLFIFFLQREHYQWSEFHGNKAFYFQESFVALRSFLYLVLAFISLHNLLKWPALALINFFFIGNFFAFDWGMSLEKEWASSLYGLIYMANGAQATMALLMLISFPKLEEKVKVDFVHLCLTCGIIWFYLHFSQFVIIWMGNLPREATFYSERWETFGGMVIFITVVFRLIPLAVISLDRRLKCHSGFVGIASILILLLSVFEVFWLVR